jgi:hypothetical protein
VEWQICNSGIEIVCAFLGTSLLPNALNVHRRFPTPLTSPLTAHQNLRAFLAACRLGSVRSSRGAACTTDCLTPANLSWSAILFYYFMFREIGGKPRAWCKICYKLTATGVLQLPHELPYDFHPGFFPFCVHHR